MQVWDEHERNGKGQTMTKEDRLVEELLDLMYNELYMSINTTQDGYINLDTTRLREKFRAFVKAALDIPA